MRGSVVEAAVVVSGFEELAVSFWLSHDASETTRPNAAIRAMAFVFMVISPFGANQSVEAGSAFSVEASVAASDEASVEAAVAGAVVSGSGTGTVFVQSHSHH